MMKFEATGQFPILAILAINPLISRIRAISTIAAAGERARRDRLIKTALQP
jgi:hypothetical protein